MLQENDKKLLNWHKKAHIDRIKEILLQDNILITSTDTIPGFLAHLSQKSFEKLNNLKKDRTTKPYLVLVGSWDKLPIFIQCETIDQKIRLLLDHEWQSAVTFVFNSRPDLPGFLISPEQTIAIRRPQHPGLRAILAFFDGLFSTSANRSGQKAPIGYDEIDQELIDEVSYLVFNEEEKNPAVSQPSTILDLTHASDGIIYILREGYYTVQNLEGLYDFCFKNAHDLQAALQLIQQAKTITLLTHYNPDGDGISACAALAYVLEKQGKIVETVYPTKTEEDIKRQPKNILIGQHQQIPDLIITTDTSVYKRLYYPDVFKDIPLINIDHHLNNEIQGTVNFVSVEVSSTCELLYLLLQTWYPAYIDTDVAEALLYGILYDTQVFYNQATRPHTLRVAAELIDCGANLCVLQQELLCNKNPEIIKFWGSLLSNVTTTPDGRAAWIIISQHDLKSRGLTLSATVGFSNFLAQLSHVDITILFYESEDGKTKVSLRSKNTDVNKFAGQFGGGGHKNASGITSVKPLDELVQEITQALMVLG